MYKEKNVSGWVLLKQLFIEKVLRLPNGSRTPQKTKVRLSCSGDQRLMVSTLSALKEMLKKEKRGGLQIILVVAMRTPALSKYSNI